MDDFLIFISHHWILVSLFTAALMLLIILESQQTIAGAKVLSPQQLSIFLNQNLDQTVLIDLRENNTFLDGHLTNAINLPLANLSNQTDKLRNHHKKKLILCCANGTNAAKAVQTLKPNFPEIYILQGGMTAWQQAGFPLVKK